MATYVSNRDGGSTDEQGHYRFQVKVWDGNIENGMVVTQNSPLGMSVLVGTGDLKIDYSNYAYTAWNDANSSVTITTADGSNPRIDRIVAYIDRGMTPSVSPPNNQGMLKFMAVAGTPNAVPTRPSDATVNSAVGASNPWCDLANVLVGTGVTTIVNSNITDTRQPISLSISADDGGWLPSIYTPNTITSNGNRSYDLVFNGTDLTDTISEGMRVRTARTVAAPTYMGGAFNGTTHYFTKTSPTSTPSTVTNNFSLKATIEPSAYAVGYIQGRGDATSANGLFLRMNADGTVSVGVSNAGVLNYRIVTTYQSLPLNKKTKVWATWASGTVVILFDGVSVPVAAAVTGGTAPTTAGTGGDFSIGRWGAYSSGYFTGYISDVGVFNAVLAEATMRSYDSQALTGAETNCIGAWSLNNTGVNQQAPGTNDLTATGGVGYSNRSPYGNNGVSATLDYGVVMAKSFSTDTTLTVQVPEGCTIPTSGGVASVDYSINDVPYGFPRDEGKWRIQSIALANITTGIGAINEWFGSNAALTVPKGSWCVGYQANCQLSSSASGSREGSFTLWSTSLPVTNGSYSHPLASFVYGASATAVTAPASKSTDVTLSASEKFTITAQIASASGTETYTIRGDRGVAYIYADNAYI